MPRHDAETADCRVFTYKEGLLSAVAHDLELRVGSFEVELSDDRASVTATFEPRSIRVVDAIVEGRRSPGTLSEKDKAKIESNIVTEVIPVKQHADVRFTSSEIREVDAGWEIRGTLELAGHERELTIPVHREEGRAVGEVTLHQPDFGIKPYSAMLGALKIQPDIKIRIELPIE
ncbi:MAG TPA: YceI family protein [Sandaracinaceae bacterium LLY-WYZ-13_1]|nr:YceI family protein [Sandaracinaceae bacterium LLY-WYZ-13_1]